jgi:hypothetical protein
MAEMVRSEGDRPRCGATRYRPLFSGANNVSGCVEYGGGSSTGRPVFIGRPVRFNDTADLSRGSGKSSV